MQVSIDLTSIGSAASQLQIPVASIERIADQLGIKPTSRINGVTYLTASELEAIADAARRERQRAV